MSIRRAGFTGFLLLLLALVLPLSRPAGAQGRGPRFVANQLLVKYRLGVAETARRRARDRVRGRLHHVVNPRHAERSEGAIELIDVDAASPVTAAVNALRLDPDVEYAEPNWIYTHQTVPNDPKFAQLWALNNTGQVIAGRAGAADADINAPEAWSTSLGSPQVYVGVVDEGIDITHEDLGVQPGGPIWTNPYDPPDGIDNDGNGFVDDVHGWDFANGDDSVYDGSAIDPTIDAHGTHVSGTIGARANNGIGVTGINWSVRIVPAKFLNPGGGTTEGAVRAIDYLTDLKTRHGLNLVAINNSWGGGGYSQALYDAIVRAARADILFIVAAGNGGADGIGDDNDVYMQYPANYDTTPALGYNAVISVAATGQSDELAAFSNYGAKSVTLGAPGSYILSTTPQNSYSYYSGTSMATPHVTGAAALVNAATALTGRDLRARLITTLRPLASLQGRTATGGRLNLQAALGATAPPQAALPAGWAARDIGAVGLAGSTGVSGGTFTIFAAGADVWGSSDAFHFAYRTLSGDGEIVAHVRSIAGTQAWTKVGVMLRERLDASSPHAFMLVSAAKGTALQRRLTTAGATASTSGGAAAAPQWVRLTRVGQTITASVSANGTAWTVVGSDTFTMPATVYAGLAVSSHDAAAMATGVFDSVAVSTAASASDEVVLYPGQAATSAGRWSAVADSTAAAGLRLQNPDAAAPKVLTASAAPADFFDVTFRADAGKPYRLWIRGKSSGDVWSNDSVHVQFSDSVDAAGAATYRIGTTESTVVNLEDCAGCGVSGWGWQDNGYGAGVRGPAISFKTTGTHTLRVQVREDGLGIDQIVLSAAKYLSAPPGALKQDTTILAK